MKPSSVIMGAAAFFAVGLVSARYAMPTKQVRVVERVEVEAKREAKTEAATTEVLAKLDTGARETKAKTRIVKVWVKPSGERHVETTETSEEVTEAKLLAIREEMAQQIRAEERQTARMEAKRELDLRVRDTSPPRWSLGGGVYLDRLSPNGGYVAAGVRVMGPLWLDVTAGARDGVFVSSVGGRVTW